MDTKAIIIGASGLVGSALLREFSGHFCTVGTYCQSSAPDLVHLDLRDQDEIQVVFRRIRPSIVLCPAANPDVEFCERDRVATRKVNVEGLQNLVVATADIGASLVYFSSEYVFDGTGGPYSENDVCHPLNEYGRQKLECERLVATQLDRYVIGRISGVYNWERQKKNFVVRLIESLRSNLPFKVPCDQVITPTYGPNLARIVHHLIDRGCDGLFHLSGSLPLLRTEFAHLIADVFDLDASLITPVRTSELGLRAVRPRAAGLRTDKVRALLDFPVASPREGLEAMRREMECHVELSF